MKKIIFLFGVLFFTLAANAQINVKIGLSGNLPIGNMSHYYKRGIGVDVNVNYLIWRKFGVGINSGFQLFSSKSAYNFNEADFYLIPIRLSLIYYLGDKKFKPYFGGELGVNYEKLSYLDLYYGAQKYHYSRFGCAPVIGFQVDFSKLLALNVNTKYNIMTKGKDEYSEKSPATYLGLNLGLVFKF